MNYPKVTLEEVEASILEETYTLLPNKRTTICQLTLDNGFTVEGSSACVCKENYDPLIENKIARANALEKVWQVLGFRLADRLAVLKRSGPPTLTTEEGGVFVGSKALWATPMTRRGYNDYRGWIIPEGENPDDEGYLVEYLDGGHISWSPKDVFERNYIRVDGEVKSTARERALQEKKELQGRLEKLQAFLGRDPNLNEETLNLLRYQLMGMEHYNEALTKRLVQWVD